MFRHKNKNKVGAADNGHESESREQPKQIDPEQAVLDSAAKDADPPMLRDLLEKNLKWSQIIYEQNRRINHKLFWMAVGNWLRVFLILIPLIIAAWFLPPLFKQVWNEYGALLGGERGGGAVLPSNLSPSTVEQLLKLLPLSPAQEQQIKAVLK